MGTRHELEHRCCSLLPAPYSLLPTHGTVTVSVTLGHTNPDAASVGDKSQTQRHFFLFTRDRATTETVHPFRSPAHTQPLTAWTCGRDNKHPESGSGLARGLRADVVRHRGRPLRTGRRTAHVLILDGEEKTGRPPPAGRRPWPPVDLYVYRLSGRV